MSMLVMCANQCGLVFGRLLGRFPGKLGHLYSPGSQRRRQPWLSYALDNGAFGSLTKKQPWDEASWRSLLNWGAQDTAHPPMWALVPDVVEDPHATLERWHAFAPIARAYGWPLAFAAQDGHTPADVPTDADVVFIGGSTAWKLANIPVFCQSHRRVHVGRVNTYGRLRYAADCGAESCDGTGWFRGDQKQLAGLERFLTEEQALLRETA